MANSEKIEIHLKVHQKVVSLKVQPEFEPYFRKAASFVNQRLTLYMTQNNDLDLKELLIIVAIEGLVDSQKFEDKYLMLQQDLNKRLDDLNNRLTLN